MTVNAAPDDASFELNNQLCNSDLCCLFNPFPCVFNFEVFTKETTPQLSVGIQL